MADNDKDWFQRELESQRVRAEERLDRLSTLLAAGGAKPGGNGNGGSSNATKAVIALAGFLVVGSFAYTTDTRIAEKANTTETRRLIEKQEAAVNSAEHLAMKITEQVVGLREAMETKTADLDRRLVAQEKEVPKEIGIAKEAAGRLDERVKVLEGGKAKP